MAKKKSVQKLTEIEELSTPSEVKEYLNSHPNEYENVLDNLQERMNETYEKKQGHEHKIVEMASECYKLKGSADNEIHLRNITYEANQAIISRCLHNHIIENRGFPTITKIGNDTGLSRTTIHKHLSEGLKSKYSKIVAGKLEYMTSSALAALYYIGINDSNANALKHFIELSGAINKSSSNTVNNYIQINNLKLSTEEFNRLPEDVILELEQVITKSMERD